MFIGHLYFFFCMPFHILHQFSYLLIYLFLIDYGSCFYNPYRNLFSIIYCKYFFCCLYFFKT